MFSSRNGFTGITFDDVLLLPGYTDFERKEIDLQTNLTRKIKLRIPLVSSPMDTVTESKLAISLASLGGAGVIHRNLTINDQAKEVLKVKRKNLLVGAAIGVNQSHEERLKALVKAQVDFIVIDSAHGFTKKIIETVRNIKKTYPHLQLIAGNIATYEGALALIKAGVDGLRVGMGPGAICMTRIVSGMGVPQISAIKETAKAGIKYKVPVIADGGIKYSGDIVKALAAGADSVMTGSFFASTIESPGKVIKLKREQVPSRFLSILKTKQNIYIFKEYRGMGSVGAMKKGAEIKSEGEFHGKNYQDRVLVAEGVEGYVPIKGTVKSVVDQVLGGIKSGMYYVGAKNIKQLHQKGRFIPITQASLIESHPHSILISNAGSNYS
ncbi:guanosine monophosphate reductase [Candidatus Roizmanbacteria bacterium CG22_combo_CG10-13_8_21_14_all_35_9]|uniref:Guanosine monophosphate reductase n=3 Tax=Candidatus Roizmaniibacteriota TaxID=1752723 RepID=A0A2H0BXJ5_9BACT|nr:MAG: guanosine monophosphate reductase [Candidatus Roizmanbacteria bacterium CG23_combo_of_CG06-09_8_20_14_all_35_49]PIP62331.1 MAG: guanosine monophosphate reductase [Candidatus Roizmanbacteria bacterium CG22_combo_CG10-13_8_21_14_all_35_9]PIY70784.1 MAG: guanosine monophosphate reductase [Candidatus Roizmanbacteria bacterium CG_4_10_14_0_8_um_filter_35_28]PJC82356.1 MAG: guanosine monophosphate reductase [Candidatus Roizmanbacteria bacterium CG_4_8_14_3_um_filter_35_14]